MGPVQEPLAEGTKGAPHLGPERPKIYSDLSPKEEDWYNADIKETNILLQWLPKDIYTLINHYTDSKDIWDNVKMLLEGSKVTKEDQESQLVEVQLDMGEFRIELGMLIWVKQDRLSTTTAMAQENRVALDAEQLLFLTGEEDNAIDDDASMTQTMFMANLSSADPVIDEARPSYDLDILSVGIQKALTKEIKEMKDVFEELEAEVAQNVVDRKHDVTVLTTKNVNMKAQVLDKVNSISKDHVKLKVLAPGKYAIDVEPIVPRVRNNREAHFDYLRNLKESIETIPDIVEEAKVVRPLDRSIVSACRYTKHSRELLEYAIGTCPQDSHQRDKKLAHVPLIREKQVTFVEPSNTLNSNTQKHVAKVNTQNTNVPVPPSTGVNRYTNIIQIVLWYIDSGCSKHMTRDHSRLMNFVKKFTGIVRFENDHFGAIMGYGDYVIGDSVISRHFLPKDSSQNSTTERCCRKTKPYSRRGCSDNADNFQGSDVSVGRSGKVIESTTKEPDESRKPLTFDGLTKPMAPVHLSTGPAPNLLMRGQRSSGLVANSVPATPYVPQK
nr:integrase, catalytic region, zinc finger, CCHC-type, peptidase aspartic, catalytic [Tanacetum cinerariifolium]